MKEQELLSTRMFLVKVTLIIGQEKYFLSALFWKLIFSREIFVIDSVWNL